MTSRRKSWCCIQQISLRTKGNLANMIDPKKTHLTITNGNHTDNNERQACWKGVHEWTVIWSIMLYYKGDGYSNDMIYESRNRKLCITWRS